MSRDSRTAPPLFREPRGSYAATWGCRWSRVRCGLGFHVWWLGPYAAGDPPGYVRDVMTGEPYFVPDHLVAEFCGAGSPWCKAWRIRKR